MVTYVVRLLEGKISVYQCEANLSFSCFRRPQRIIVYYHMQYTHTQIYRSLDSGLRHLNLSLFRPVRGANDHHSWQPSTTLPGSPVVVHTGVLAATCDGCCGRLGFAVDFY